MRTPFQRDRDRIVHSKAFRRLKHKTQVFIAPEGDHYRTRLTHTLETCGISRTVARALGLNEDLTEAIGLGHDLGHPPFGHIGEEALDQTLQELAGLRFRHNVNSLRMVDVLERDGEGLNLTEPVRDGILNHTGPDKPATLEGRIVRLVDRVAYINHDIDDALRAQILVEADLPAGRDRAAGADGFGAHRHAGPRHRRQSPSTAGDIVQSEEIAAAMLRLRKFMFDRVYLGTEARSEHERVHRTMRGLFDHYMAHPGELPGGDVADDERLQAVTDYIAGMTDRYCIARYRQIALPEESTAVSLFTQDTIERVRESASIVEIISAYTDLRRAGESYSGLCPFHDERTPSFSVSARDNLYYCFGCEAGGDVIKFVQEKEGLGFPEAVEVLAERYGIEIQREEEDPQAERERQRRQRLFQLLERTAAFYVTYLADSPKAKKARDYLAEPRARRRDAQ